MKKTKKKVQVLNKIQFAPIFDMDGNLFQTNNRLGPSLETTFKILRSEESWTGDTALGLRAFLLKSFGRLYYKHQV
ncbi:hypothetical protein [Peribacillus simplex]|uniref:hypothetical protein n=1 Tax=Peribacillus simplex TaxID=1478 RepID=UPI003D2CB34B